MSAAAEPVVVEDDSHITASTAGGASAAAAAAAAAVSTKHPAAASGKKRGKPGGCTNEITAVAHMGAPPSLVATRYTADHKITAEWRPPAPQERGCLK